mgnify:CR=1 FL=1
MVGLLLPDNLIEDKISLKNELNKIIENAVNSVTLREDYFLVMHAKFDEKDASTFVVSQLVASLRLPPFTSNSMVFFVSPSRGIIELLWMVAAKKPNEKLKVEFNKSGVAYLQAKGAMPS